MNRIWVSRVLVVVATLVVGASVFVAIYQNPPYLQRLRAMDARRVQNLSSLQGQINRTWHSKKVLPDSLAALCDHCVDDYKDPETKAPYTYEKTGDQTYRLCAHFATSNVQDSEPRRYNTFLADWRHEAGLKCFDLNVPLGTGSVSHAD